MASKRPISIEEYIEAAPFEDLVRRIAEYRLQEVRKRDGDSFW